MEVICECDRLTATTNMPQGQANATRIQGTSAVTDWPVSLSGCLVSGDWIGHHFELLLWGKKFRTAST